MLKATLSLVIVVMVAHAWGGGPDCNDNGVPDDQELGDPGPFDDFGVAYWRFEDPNGDPIADSGPNGLDGVQVGDIVLQPDPSVELVPLGHLVNTQSVSVRIDPCVTSDCCTPHPTVGCSDADCTAIICADDPFCCEVQWDVICADAAASACATFGAIEVADTGGLLSFGSSSFTIEAWVRLDEVSGADGPRQWLCMKKVLPGSDNQLDYGVIVQAGSQGTTGRELQLRYGQGGSNAGVVSNLEITDNEWHHVSVAYNADTNRLRFGLDGVFDNHTLDKPDITNGGPLTIGKHQNAQGENNQRLRGRVDEMRISAEFLRREMLLTGFRVGGDCNGNGVPDDCDFYDGVDVDCNANGFLDGCDVADGVSEDCQDDGIPDECQIGQGVRIGYSDDGDEGAAFPEGVYTAFLEKYVVEDDRGVVRGIPLWFRGSTIGEPASVYLWSDPNQDGNPDDALVIRGIDLVVSTPLTEAQGFEPPVDIPDTYVGPNGTSYFVGAVYHDPGPHAIGIDIDDPDVLGVSWVIGASEEIDPNDLSANATEFALIEDSIPANWMLRVDTAPLTDDCNGNGVPDDCDIENGTSDDCNEDTIPDECQLGSAPPFEYALDGGAVGITWGLEQPGTLAWLNQFVVDQPGAINEVSIDYGELPSGHPVMVYVWSDPNGDGNPDDAQVLASVETTVCGGGFCATDVGIVVVGPPGTSFFAGAITDPEDMDPIPVDTGVVLGQSWVAGNFAGAPIDPNDLSSGVDYFGLIDDFNIPPGGPCPGSAHIRATAASTIPPNDQDENGVPDECDDACPADVDGDGTVDVTDLVEVILNWGDCRGCPADVDGNGAVDVTDLVEVILAWGPCP